MHMLAGGKGFISNLDVVTYKTINQFNRGFMNNPKLRTLISIPAFFIFIILISGFVQGSDTNQHVDNEFQLSFNPTNDQINLICQTGCAWKTLSFECSDENCTQAINRYGTTVSQEHGSGEDSNDGFFITTTRNNTDISFRCVIGCNWDHLEYQSVENGVTHYFDNNGKIDSPETE